MKIDRPTGPEPGLEVPATGNAQAPARGSFSEHLEATDPAAAIPEEVTRPNSIAADLLAQLRSGQITSDQLVATLVERVSQGAPLSAAGISHLRSTLESLLESDPALRRLVRALETG